MSINLTSSVSVADTVGDSVFFTITGGDDAGVRSAAHEESRCKAMPSMFVSGQHLTIEGAQFAVNSYLVCSGIGGPILDLISKAIAVQIKWITATKTDIPVGFPDAVFAALCEGDQLATIVDQAARRVVSYYRTLTTNMREAYECKAVPGHYLDYAVAYVSAMQVTVLKTDFTPVQECAEICPREAVKVLAEAARFHQAFKFYIAESYNVFDQLGDSLRVSETHIWVKYFQILRDLSSLVA